MKKRGVIYRKSKPQSRSSRFIKRKLQSLDQNFQRIVLFTILGLLCIQFVLQHATRTVSGFITPLSNIQNSPAFLAEIGSSLSDYGENTVPAPPSFTNQIVFHGLREKKEVALTFDADMTDTMKYFLTSGQVKSYYDRDIVSILNQTHTKATFFLTGMWIELYPNETRELAGNPLFELGNHSYSHPSFDGPCFGLRQIPDSDDEQEIQKTQELLKRMAQIEGKFFRFPGGCSAQSDVNIVSKLGLTVVHWDVAGVDGFTNNAGSIEQNVIRNAQNGSIIVLHVNGPPNDPKTSEALPVILATLKEKGFEFVKVSELLSGNTISSNINIKEYVDRRYGL